MQIDKNKHNNSSIGLGVGLRRHIDTPDEHVVNVWITFHAKTDDDADRSSMFEIDSIDLDLPDTVEPLPGEELTDREKAHISKWFDANQKRAEAAMIAQHKAPK